MSDEKPHRSRTAWPGPTSFAGLEPGHDHDPPAPLVQRVRLLTRAVVIFGVCLAGIGTLIVLVIMQRGAARDREDAREEQRINDRFCEFLALAPDDHPLADDMRAELGCPQPGRAIGDYPPDVQEQLANRRPPESRSLQPVRPEQLPPREGPGPRDFPLPSSSSTPSPSSSTTPPLVDLTPITDPLCEATGVCG